MSALESAAESVSERIIGDDDDALRLDPMFIAAIIAAIMQAIEMINECREKSEIASYASRVSQRGAKGHRIARWRLSRVVRRELGDDADRQLVKDVTTEIMSSCKVDTVQDIVNEVLN